MVMLQAAGEAIHEADKNSTHVPDCDHSVRSSAASQRRDLVRVVDGDDAV